MPTQKTNTKNAARFKKQAAEKISKPPQKRPYNCGLQNLNCCYPTRVNHRSTSPPALPPKAALQKLTVSAAVYSGNPNSESPPPEKKRKNGLEVSFLLKDPKKSPPSP